ncbi:T9SS type A sorting domain-containing protein [Fulvivirgaceae bacterium PWU4]|uniref:T9SS type A sorting domain-containing protein n=1 Tax=Chryseosolibacter histidini TaxID=2782349 RepID=A0AAP2GPV8_9BACT|nr:T9SS type A sorting domain-containing protein [Chryseosolibacter histidini]MBT1698350.1 T9SS type A sorting domain-containing protein [Chryseosolibacter histidini]
MLTLPFWDDFTTSYGPYPDTTRWKNSYSVWVNNGMAINPPTLNVATFDGLDSAGLAYNENEVLLNGFTDTLMSKNIDLSDPTLPMADRGTVFLSFFYQWRGNGEAPDPQDYLQVDFKYDSAKWETVLTLKPNDTFKPDTFYTAIVKVDGEKFFDADFQFRIMAYGRQSGPYDTWNVDYVYLNKGRSITDTAFPDQAITSSLSSLFKNRYRAMPYQHFRQDLSLLHPKFNIYNLRGGVPEVLTYFTEATFHNDVAAPYTISNLGGDSTNINDDGSNTIFAFEKRTVTLKDIPNPNDAAQFNPNAKYVDVDLKVHLLTGDNIDLEDGSPAKDYDPNYAPIDFRVNDTITNTYSLRDYYAYDDGVAEYAAGLIETGDLIAYEFELPFNDTFKQDTLIAFDIYLPPYGMTSNQTVDFFIYGDNNGVPDDTAPLLRFSGKSVSRKKLNEFQRVAFLPAILIDQRKFYIGWKQPSVGKMLVGLDISNDTGDKVFVNVNGTWKKNNRVHGSLMVRPIFGSGLVETQVGTEEVATPFSVFPNPSRGSFYIEGPLDHLEILSITGQRVSFESVHESDRTLVQLNQPAGLYLLRCTKGTVTKTHKIIVAR